jgi:hypothetical protein
MGFEWPVDIPVKRLQLVTKVRRKEKTVTPISFMQSQAAIDKRESRISNRKTAGLLKFSHKKKIMKKIILSPIHLD